MAEEENGDWKIIYFFFGEVICMDLKNSAMYLDLLSLVSIPSVSPSVKENDVVQYIYDRFMELDYFKKNPWDLQVLPCDKDLLGRNIVFAIVRAQPSTSSTIILMGHMDVISPDVYGKLKEWAFSPEELSRRIGEEDIDENAREDLDSGEWIFGRGVADMKAGVALCMDKLREAARDPSALKVNLAVLFVPDEENNSGGMLGAVPYLAEYQEKGLSYLACINTEPTFSMEPDPAPAVYIGSLGKLNTFFYCLGSQSHVGEYYRGLSSGLLASHINLMLDGNPEFADSHGDAWYSPYGCIKMNDMREEYSATIVSRGVFAYSYLTSSKKPSEILEDLETVAMEAQKNALDHYEKNARSFAIRSGAQNIPVDWEPRVMSYATLEEKTRALYGERFDKFVEYAFNKCGDEADERDKGIRLVHEMTMALGMEGPIVIYGLLPPWYPHRINEELDRGETVIKAVATELVQKAREEFGQNMEIRKFYEGVSDLSYCGYTGGKQELDLFGNNCPVWNRLYHFPSEDLVKLRIPIMNLGPRGKDLHKRTERIHLPYYMDILPKLMDLAISCISALNE